MKLIFSIVLLLPTVLLAQLNGPEAVDHDPSTDLYYISNKSAGNILVGPAGGPYSVLTTDVSSPHGIEVIADKLYVCDGNAIKEFQLPGGALLNTYTISGASFLNGLTSDRISMLWFTDFSQSRLHSLDLNTGVDQVVVSNTGTTPNGVIYDQSNVRLIIVNWGSNASILQWDLSSEFLSTVASNTGLNNCDGVALGCDGEFYVSSWGAGAVHTFSNDFSTGPTLFVDGLSQPSDIHYNLAADTLISPNFGSSTVTFHEENCLGTGIADLELHEMNVWPNPGNGFIRLEEPMEGELEVIDHQGKLLRLVQFTGSTVNLTDLPDGQYILNFDLKGAELPHRTIYLKTSN